MNPLGSPRPTGLNHPRLDRRRLLQAFGLGSAVLAGGGLLSACGTEGTADNAQQEVKDLSETEKLVAFSNWPLYIDTKKGKHPTLQAFEKETGIEVEYTEEINDNASYFAKIRPQLSSGQATGADIVVFTSDWAGHMIELGWVQEIDWDNVPNAANLLESLQNPAFDPDGKYTLPWQTGLTGLGVNTQVIGRDVETIEELFTAPDLKGRVTVLSEMSDTIGVIMLELGIDPMDFSQSEFDQALGKLESALESKQIRQVTGNEYAPQLAKGDIAACIAWSGDVIQLQFEDPKLQFVIPPTGGIIWSDNMQIPALATHKANAEALMDYYYRPEVAAELAAWVNYICPVQGAKEAMQQIDPSLVDNELIFPSEDTLSRVHDFKLLPWDEREKLVEQFTQTVGL